MRIRDRYKPELCAAKNERVGGCPEPYFEKSDCGRSSKMIATDGHCMIVVPVEGHRADRDGKVPKAALKQARKVAVEKKLDTAEVDCSAYGDVAYVEAPNGEMTPYRRDEGKLFPTHAWRDVMESAREGTFTIGLNLTMLGRIAEAMGCKETMLRVTFGGTLDPVLIEDPEDLENGAKATMMPSRLEHRLGDTLYKR